jgi:hypothetical protein
MVRVNPDPYLVLGVSPTATQAEITHAYRDRLRAHHPDTRHAPSPLLRVTVLAHGRGVPVEADPGVNWPRSNGSGRGVRGRGVAAAVRVSRAGCHGWFR